MMLGIDNRDNADLADLIEQFKKMAGMTAENARILNMTIDFSVNLPGSFVK